MGFNQPYFSIWSHFFSFPGLHFFWYGMIIPQSGVQVKLGLYHQTLGILTNIWGQSDVYHLHILSKTNCSPTKEILQGQYTWYPCYINGRPNTFHLNQCWLCDQTVDSKDFRALVAFQGVSSRLVSFHSSCHVFTTAGSWLWPSKNVQKSKFFSMNRFLMMGSAGRSMKKGITVYLWANSFQCSDRICPSQL